MIKKAFKQYKSLNRKIIQDKGQEFIVKNLQNKYLKIYQITKTYNPKFYKLIKNLMMKKNKFKIKK